MPHPFKFDAVVVGGGPAGLLGALYLARFRRNVIVLDGGQSRAQRIPTSHNYPGYADGISGADLLQSLRMQADHYRIERKPAQVDSISQANQGFRLCWAGGEASTRCILLATGASDIEPAMLHAAEALRDGALRYCPVCDGYEAIDQAIGVLAAGATGIREALYIRHFSEHVTLFQDAELKLSESDRGRLATASITVAPGLVQSIRLWNGRVTVRHGESESLCDTVYSALGMNVHSGLAADLGAEVDAFGYLHTDAHQQTTIPGLFAAGDVASGLNQISVAFGSAAVAASAMHRALLA